MGAWLRGWSYKLCGKESVHNEISTFANDPKLFWLMKCQADEDKLQEDFMKLH
jgi:hypothetical protein